MSEYDLNKRPMPGGAMSPRLNPKFTSGPLGSMTAQFPLPRTMVRETGSSGRLSESRKGPRRSAIGLHPRFDNKS